MFDWLTIQKSVQSFAAQVKDLKANIELLKRQREDTANAPPAISELKAMVERHLDARAAEYEKALAQTLSIFARKPHKVSDPFPLQQQALTALPMQPGRMGIPSDVDAAITALLRNQITKALFERIDRLDWPKQGLPAKERAAAVAKLDREIEKLESDCEGLLRTARASGVYIDA